MNKRRLQTNKHCRGYLHMTSSLEHHMLELRSRNLCAQQPTMEIDEKRIRNTAKIFVHGVQSLEVAEAEPPAAIHNLPSCLSTSVCEYVMITHK